MIKSMTGYGAGESIALSKRFTVEIKSVNHRYSDITVKLPRAYMYLEDTLKKTVASFISRGKTDVFLSVEDMENTSGEVNLNLALAAEYYKALKTLKDELSLSGDIRLENLTKFGDIFTVKTVDDDADEIIKTVKEAAEAAGKAFNDMRAVEGEKLCKDLEGGIAFLNEQVAKVGERAPKIVEDYAARIRERMKEILDGYAVDEGRLLNEVAVFADRVDINEELVRLKSHISQMQSMIKSDAPQGKKLDFVIQEMNRETNTIGSKSNDLEVAKIVIDMKSCIEKIREQIQNVE
ncbi:MAG: YicC family protein [Clostridia bacterium]|nr:YicC family protein [Clostridia bacterium]